MSYQNYNDLNITDWMVIPVKEYKELLEDSKVLKALERAGVDNWEWYDDVMESLGNVDE
jgi:hypothetical protein